MPMDLQNTYYVFALVFMSLGIIFLFGCIGFLAFIFFMVRGTQKQIGKTVDRLAESAENPSGVNGIGTYILGTIIKKIRGK